MRNSVLLKQVDPRGYILFTHKGCINGLGQSPGNPGNISSNCIDICHGLGSQDHKYTSHIRVLGSCFYGRQVAVRSGVSYNINRVLNIGCGR